MVRDFIYQRHPTTLFFRHQCTNRQLFRRRVCRTWRNSRSSLCGCRCPQTKDIMGLQFHPHHVCKFIFSHSRAQNSQKLSLNLLEIYLSSLVLWSTMIISKIFFQPSSKYSLADNGSLIIKGMTEQQNGYYVCNANNYINIAHREAKVWLVGKDSSSNPSK